MMGKISVPEVEMAAGRDELFLAWKIARINARSNHIGFCGVDLHLTCIVDIIISVDTVVNKARMNVYST